MFNNANQHINVYGDDVEVDYRGYEVKEGEKKKINKTKTFRFCFHFTVIFVSFGTSTVFDHVFY